MTGNVVPWRISCMVANFISVQWEILMSILVAQIRTIYWYLRAYSKFTLKPCSREFQPRFCLNLFKNVKFFTICFHQELFPNHTLQCRLSYCSFHQHKFAFQNSVCHQIRVLMIAATENHYCTSSWNWIIGGWSFES